MDISGATVLLTGGAGLVGSHIVEELVREGAKVIVYDSLVRGRRDHLDWAVAHGDVKLIQADLTDRSAMRDAVQGVDYVNKTAQSPMVL